MPTEFLEHINRSRELTFSNAGDYTVQSVIQFPGTNGLCADTSSLDITVLPRPEVR